MKLRDGVRARACLAGMLASGLLLAGRPATASLGLAGVVVGSQPAANADAKTMADFVERAKRYGQLHRKVEATLPKLAAESSPTQIDTHQRQFAAQMKAARADARPGEIFTPAMQTVVRSLIARLFHDPQARRHLRSSIMDDNPRGSVQLAVNARYPDVVPLSTMPPDVLKQLPVLPQELEYRFVGETLILLDPDAHIVVDYVEHALPR